MVWVDIPDNKVHGAHMGPTWGRQGPGGPHVGHMNLAFWDVMSFVNLTSEQYCSFGNVLLYTVMLYTWCYFSKWWWKSLLLGTWANVLFMAEQGVA